jgi:hypothetical protein
MFAASTARLVLLALPISPFSNAYLVRYSVLGNTDYEGENFQSK